MKIVATKVIESESDVMDTLQMSVFNKECIGLEFDRANHTVTLVFEGYVMMTFFCDPNREDPFHVAIPVEKRPN